MDTNEKQAREIIDEIRELLNQIDVKVIEADPKASYFAKEVAKQSLLDDHRLAVRFKQHWK